ncbi:hypothetical protein IVG45_15440 [Methylomonas sp. LL1]|uniref:DUF5677 domain-containing protein n=1 Tax=Methylomonas sp. LL1 TaxID=2785785 RepID=UPI0018C391A9|nr:DUF5677 domain-containing protein [Methylomonas sp. LL1]QPK62235.1 hypothetical protein IVG45_15440 [Methylomonas sp. LL1]
MDEFKQEIKNALAYAEHLKFDKQHPWHRNLIALYCSLIEYFDSLIFLVENDKCIAIPVVFRGLLEAYVDFRNLAEDRLYGYNMEASYAKEWLKIIEEASQKKNAFLASIAEDPTLDTQVQEQKNKLAELRGKGYKALNQFEKFDKAGMVDEYRSVYNFVCSHSHNDIRSLIVRFFIINEAENDFEMALFKEQEPGEYDHYLITGKHFLRNGSHTIHAILETGHEDIFAV